MDTNTKKIYDQFIELLNDNILNRKESRTLKEMFEEIRPGRHDKHSLRSKLFELAKERLTGDNSLEILDWLENSVKLLIDDYGDETPANKVLFSPGEECRNAVMNIINSAKNKLRICVFTISDDDIANSIIKAHKRGINIKIISDDDKQYDIGSDVNKFKNVGINVRVDQTPNHMHNKFMTADNLICLTGSYNWTRSAARYNQENILICKDKYTIKKFDSEFDRLWDEFK